MEKRSALVATDRSFTFVFFLHSVHVNIGVKKSGCFETSFRENGPHSQPGFSIEIERQLFLEDVSH